MTDAPFFNQNRAPDPHFHPSSEHDNIGGAPPFQRLSEPYFVGHSSYQKSSLLTCKDNEQAYKEAYEALNRESPKPVALSESDKASAKMLADIATDYEKSFAAMANQKDGLSDRSFDRQRLKDSGSMKAILSDQSPDKTDALIARADELLASSPYKIVHSGSQVWLGSKDIAWQGIQNPENKFYASILLKDPAPFEICKGIK